MAKTAPDLDELVQQGREVRAAALQHGRKVAVIELLQEQRAVQLGQHRQDDADHDGKAVPLIVLQDEGHGAAHGLAGILRPFRGVHRAPGGAAHRFRRHIMHPPSRRSRRRPASGPDRPPDEMRFEASSCSCVPKPLTRPSSRTRMRSASCTLEIRWAMMIFVVFGISSRRALRMRASVAVSTALVESSRIRIFGFFSRARAMHRRCFCPPETFVPPCSM